MNPASANPLVPAVLLAAWLAIVAIATPKVLAKSGLVRKNFLGRSIPVALGWAIILWACPVLAWDPWHLWTTAERAAFCTVLAGFGLLGFVDDLKGDRRATGLRGHLRQLIAHRRVTTGIIKAAGIPIVSFVITWRLLRQPGLFAVWDALLLSLGANALNLLDLRPGRACAAFLALGGILVAPLAMHGHLPPLLAPLIGVAAIYPLDASARAMLGDTGSNALGGALALQFLLDLPGWSGRLTATILLVALHAAAEKYSLTAIIEGHPILNRLDRFTGRRSDAGRSPDEGTRR